MALKERPVEAIVVLVAITGLLGALAAAFGADSRDLDTTRGEWSRGSDEDVTA